MQVDTESLASNHANIQITHVEPHFTRETLGERPSLFERANNLSRFVFETPFTRDGKQQQADVTRQCMRKTVLTSEFHLHFLVDTFSLSLSPLLPPASHWFPYIKKRIGIIHQEQFELCPIEV